MDVSSSSAKLTEMSIEQDSSVECEETPLRSDHNRRNYRNLVAYWILGICNNFGYVVMLSAAHDILSESFNQPEADMHELPVPVNGSTRVCNPTSTGAILLADILPSLAVKLMAPFFPFVIHIRMLIVVLLSGIGYLLVSISTVEWIAIIGVAATSLGSGLGEVTLLSYSSKFDKNVVSTWSSGTGAAGILGAISYAGLTGLGFSAANALLLMLVVPVVMAITFWLLLHAPGSNSSPCKRILGFGNTDRSDTEESPTSKSDIHIITTSRPLTMKEKLYSIPPLLAFMIPLGLVYLFEYFINQGLFELIFFPDIWLDVHEQYRWMQVDYQIGVFISRSSVNLLVIRKTWILAVLQFVNVIFFLFEAIYLFVPNIWIIFAAVLWEGLLGGSAYVNTFYKISAEIPFEKREFSMGITSLSDSVGIGLAGAIALPVHNLLCKLPKS